MRIRLDADLCQGHGTCVNEAPEVFRLEGEGPVTIVIPEPSEQLRAQVADAVRYCPTGALALDD
jgi:ferredoxin